MLSFFSSFLQSALASAQSKSSGTLATLIGVATIIVTASGVFGEMQSALNAIWKIDFRGTPISRLIRARAASLGLVVSLGFLMMVSLVVSVGLTALGDYLNSVLPFGKILLTILTALFRFSSFPCFRGNLQSAARPAHPMAVLAAALPISLAAAIGSDWTMTIWTAALFAIVEPLTGQIVEPLKRRAVACGHRCCRLVLDLAVGTSGTTVVHAAHLAPGCACPPRRQASVY